MPRCCGTSSRSGEEGQKLLLSRDFVPTNRKIETNLNKFPLKFVDPATMLDQGQKWEKLYQETFGVQGAK